MANLSNINNKFLVTTGGNVLIGQTASVAGILQVGSGSGTTADVVISSSVLALLQLKDTGINKTYNIELGRDATAGDLTFRSISGEKVRFTEDGNVGIGTDSPDYELQVGDGTATETINIKASSTNPSRIFFSDNNAIAQGRIHYEHGGDYMNFWTDNTERMRIDSDGNVGIGTTSPNEKLQVAGNIHAYAPSGIDAGLFASTAAGSTTIAVRSSGITHFNGGNVGIGTTSPSEKLYVASPAGYIATFQSTTAADFRPIRFLNSAGANVGFLGNNGSNNEFFLVAQDRPLIFGTGNGGAERMRITSAGNVGINCTPSYKLQWSDGTRTGLLDTNIGAVVIGSVSNDALAFYTNLTERMRITSSGNVGIGAISPANKLFVTASTAGDYAAFIENTNSTNGYGLLARTAQTGTSSYAFAARAGSSDIFVVRGDGNVGIATTNPRQKLDTPNIVIGGSSIAANYRANSTMMDNLGGVARFYSLGADTSTGGSYQFNSLSSNLTAGAGTVMTIFNTGNVGIATAININKLDVGGNINVQGGNGSYLTFNNGDANIVINNNGSGRDLSFKTYSGSSNAERMRIDKNGNVGIGTTSPASVLHIKDNTAGPTQLSIQSNDFTRAEEINFLNPSTSAISGQIQYYTNPTVEYMSFSTSNNSAAVQRMRILGNGNVIIGTETSTDCTLKVSSTKNGSSSSPHFCITGNGYTALHWLDTNAYNIVTNSASRDIEIRANINGVILTPGATAWASNSDIALKENINPLEDVLDKIKDYRCVEYNLKNSPEDKKIGFIAQDWVNDFSPIINKDKNDMLSMKYSETIPVLLKAIQELTARIKELENK